MTRHEYNPYLPHNYVQVPATVLNWRDPRSTEIQRRQWERFCRGLVLLSCPLLWPLLILGVR